ncbi:hypothetical protein ACQUZK_09245, partial [Streptococcus pyogenes]|uniref:hypothetical protein n=1 Tax=Streptococcus pyogenes TaxID=1314 RepID=UPI003DA0EB55
MRKAPVQPSRAEVRAAELAIRELISCSDGRTLRVIDVLAPSALVVYDIQSNDAQPQVFTFAEGDELLRSRRWLRKSSTVAGENKDEDGDGAEVATEDAADEFQAERWKVVSAGIRTKELYDRRTRGAALERIAKDHRRSVKFIRETFRLAWRGGMTLASVRSDVHKRGRIRIDGKPRGAKPTVADYEPYVWPSEKFRDYVRRYAVHQYKSRTLDDT